MFQAVSGPAPDIQPVTGDDDVYERVEGIEL
jgi:hypothetical protein